MTIEGMMAINQLNHKVGKFPTIRRGGSGLLSSTVARRGSNILPYRARLLDTHGTQKTYSHPEMAMCG